MTPFWDWEVPFILWLQGGHPALTPLFRFLTSLGNEEFSLMVGPFVLWCLNKAWGVGLLLMLLGSQSVNVVLKELLRAPRPFVVHGRILQLDDPGGWSLPSGHAQNSTVIWMYLASKVQRLWFWIAAIVLVLGIILSRM
ncbi:MAG: phosphatase PAP2 family protein [Anaerolineae bacterium]|jgi:membrane-associated phospholipid phosphatase|nr:phosphatase PAP2 family protein [Anaerolineae bacterium]